MNPQTYTTGRQGKLSGVFIIVSGLLALIFAALYFLGYGSLAYQPTFDEKVYINDNLVSSSLFEDGKLKLRPGTYTIRIQSARFNTVNETVNVSLFTTKNFEPDFTERPVNDIAAAALGAYGEYGAPTFLGVRWFENDEWVAGNISPGSSSPIALQYVDGVWKVGYFGGSGYPHDLSKIPSSVAAYLQSKSIQRSPQ